MAEIGGIQFRIIGNDSGASRSLDRLADSMRRVKTASSGMSNVAGTIRKISGSLLKLSFTPLKSLTRPFREGISSVTRFASKLGEVASGFKRILGYRLIRTLIKEIGQALREGVQHVYDWSRAMREAGSGDLGRFADSMDDIATSLAYFKNSIGAAVAPLVNMLAPAIDTVTNAVVALLNAINQLIARLTGQSSWTRATRHAEEYGDAVGGAGGAAKEALKYLAPFDELNVLPSQRSGGGGGGLDDDVGGLFEEMVEFEEGISNFADRIRAAIDAENWKELGTILGDKVNEIVDSIDWAGIGTSIGKKINAWFTTKYWTLETINFTNIGAKIAEFLNNAIGNIDFEVIGASLVQKFTILGNLIIGAVENIDWTQVGESIGSFVRGAFNQASSWLEKQDFADIGRKVVDVLANIFDGLDLSETVSSISKAISEVFTSGGDFVNGVLDGINKIDWEPIFFTLTDGIINIFRTADYSKIVSTFFELLGSAFGTGIEILAGIGEAIWNYILESFQSVKDYFVERIQSEGGDIGLGILKGIYDAIVGIGTWIKENIFQPFVDGFKKAFGIASPAKEMEEPGEMVGKGILEGIAKPFKAIAEWIDEHIIQPIKDAFNKFKDSEFGSGLIGNIQAGVSLVKEGWDTVSAWVIENIGPVVSKAVKLVKSGWDTVSNWVTENIGPLISKSVALVKSGWDTVSNWVIENIGPVVSKAVSLAKSGWESVQAWVEKFKGDPVGALVSLAKSGWESVSGWLNTAAVFGAEAVEALVSLAKNDWENVSAWVNDFLGDPVNALVNLFKNGWKSVSEWVSQFMGGTVSIGVDLAPPDPQSEFETGSNFWLKYFGIPNPPELTIPVGFDTMNIDEKVNSLVTIFESNLGGEGKDWVFKVPLGFEVSDLDVPSDIQQQLVEIANDGNYKLYVPVGLLSDGWETPAEWVRQQQTESDVVEQPVGLTEHNWSASGGGAYSSDFYGHFRTNTVSYWVASHGGKELLQPVSLGQEKWSNVSDWVYQYSGGTVTKGVGLAKSGWKYVADWLKEPARSGGVVNKPVGIIKNGWTNIASWAGKYTGGALNKAVTLAKNTNQWTTIADWLKKTSQSGGIVSKEVTLKTVMSTLAATVTTMAFVSVWNSLKDKTITLTVQMNNRMGTDIANIKGAWNNMVSAWRSVPILARKSSLWYLASGGTVSSGQMFIAREAGPELVGTYGSKSAVMNNDQIVRSVSDGVAKAISNIHFAVAGMPSAYSDEYGMDEDAVYRAMVRALTETGGGETEIDVNLDGDVLYRHMVRRNRANTRMTGVNAMA